MVRFHTYGDSHASHHGGWNTIKIDGLEIKPNWLGPKLLYSFGRDKLKVVNVNEISQGDYICFCFGEIDCRCHINKYEPDWKLSIDKMVSEYFINISNNVLNLNVKTCVYNVIPQLERGTPETMWITEWEKENANNPAILPTLGSNEDRLKYSLYMNEKIKEYCDKYSFIFFNVYDKYANENGFLNSKYSDGNSHIKDSIYIKEMLIKILNEG